MTDDFLCVFCFLELTSKISLFLGLSFFHGRSSQRCVQKMMRGGEFNHKYACIRSLSGEKAETRNYAFTDRHPLN